MEPTKRVSVIVPVFNGAEKLSLCLRALADQTMPGDAVEIIVVDNNSTDAVATVRRTFPSVRWLHESKAGSYAARNRGLLEAQSDVVAFTDADCVPQPVWLTEALRTMQITGADIVGGRMEFTTPQTRRLNVYETYEEKVLSGMLDHRKLVEQGLAVTANLIARRIWFFRAGLFDDSLFSGGDCEWVERARAQGATLRYSDGAVVRHERRGSFRAVCGKHRRVIGGRAMLWRRRKSWLRIMGAVASFSCFNPLLYQFAWSRVRGSPIAFQAKFILLVAVMGMVCPAEYVRVLMGGMPKRT